MIALIQRVKQAKVEVEHQVIGEIENGLLVFLGVEKEDDEQKAQQLLDKILNYRIFSDEQGKMNLNIKQAEGNLLVVSQFTLTADTTKGRRPSFTKGATPERAEQLYDYFIEQSKKLILTQSGAFGAEMQVELINDGPVTFWLQA